MSALSTQQSIASSKNHKHDLPAPPATKPQAGSLDAILPADMARKGEEVGVKKCHMDLFSLASLSILAGAFIAMGALFATVVWTGNSPETPWGWSRMLGGMAFSLGLILVVIGGAELFTGNALIVMAWASRRVSMGQVLGNWAMVYLGNFVGAAGTAVLVFFSAHYMAADGGIGALALRIAHHKVGLGFVEAIAAGILCNVLVCLAVWMTYSCNTTVGKVYAIVLPVSAFVAAGFEHSIANMYFVPFALFIRSFAPEAFWDLIGRSSAEFADLTWSNFFVQNLIPVTIGNIIGGALLVGGVYWVIYLRKRA